MPDRNAQDHATSNSNEQAGGTSGPTQAWKRKDIMTRRRTQARHAKGKPQRRRWLHAALAGTSIVAVTTVITATGNTPAGQNAEETAATQTLQNQTAPQSGTHMTAHASSTATGLTLGGWLPYWEWYKKPPSRSPRGTLTSISSFDTTITGSADNLAINTPQVRTPWTQVVAKWARKNATTWLSVTDYTAPGQLSQALADPNKRAQLISRLTQATQAGNYTGLDLDLEGFAYRDGTRSWKETQPRWIAFIKEMSSQLAQVGKQLSVTTPPIYNDKNDASSGYWVYSWKEIAPHISKLRIMAYDYSYHQAGPIGPLPWTEKILSYATTVMPREKIELAIPSYGRNWVTNVTGTCPAGTNLKRTTLDMASGPQLAALRKAPVTYNSTYAEATFSYQLRYGSGSTSCTVYRTAWFATAESLTARIALARNSGISGIYLWTPTYLDARAWNTIDRLAKDNVIARK